MIDEYIKTNKKLRETNRLKEKNKRAFSANTGIVLYAFSLCFFIWVVFFNYNYIVDMLNYVQNVYQQHLNKEGNELFLYYLSELDSSFINVDANNIIHFNTSFFDIKETIDNLNLMNYYNVNLYELKDKYSFIIYSTFFLNALILIRGALSIKVFKELNGNTIASFAFVFLSTLPIILTQSEFSDFNSYKYINEYIKINDLLMFFIFVVSIGLLFSIINTAKDGLFSNQLNKELNSDVVKYSLEQNKRKSLIFESENEMRSVLEMFKEMNERDTDYFTIKEIINEFKELKSEHMKKMEQVKNVEKVIDGYFETNENAQHKNLMEND